MIIISLPCSVQVAPSHGKSPRQRSDAGQGDMGSAEHEDVTKAAGWDNSAKQVLGSLIHILDSSTGLKACHHIRLELYMNS